MTNIQGIKKNHTGYSVETLNNALEQVLRLPIQGKTSEQIEELQSHIMGGVYPYAEFNSIILSAGGHGMKDADAFSFLYSHMTEDFNFKKSEIDTEGDEQKDEIAKFNEKWLIEQNHQSIYKDIGLSAKQINSLYKDHIQNADGYSFIITSTTPKNKIKKFVEHTITHMKSTPTKKHKLPLKVRDFSGNKQFSVSGTKKENTVVQYVQYYKMPYNFKNTAIAYLYKNIVNQEANKVLREQKQLTYGVGISVDLSSLNILTVTANLETSPENAKKAIVELENVYKNLHKNLGTEFETFKKSTGRNFAKGTYQGDRPIRTKLKNFVQYDIPFTLVGQDIKTIMELEKSEVIKILKKYNKPYGSRTAFYKK